jgi:hypothetical protein
VFLGCPRAPSALTHYFDAGVGERWLAFAHARAEAHFTGAFLRFRWTNAAFGYLSPSGNFCVPWHAAVAPSSSAMMARRFIQ